VKNDCCGRPEWADKDGCPMDNPNEEITDCTECIWYRETEAENGSGEICRG